MDPNYAPTPELLLRSLTFKTFHTLLRLRNASSRETCWRDLVVILTSLVSTSFFQLIFFESVNTLQEDRCKEKLLEHIDLLAWLTVRRQIVTQVFCC
jgi:hypothetical protein